MFQVFMGIFTSIYIRDCN